jgi:rhodanese-related sulfurtransferase
MKTITPSELQQRLSTDPGLNVIDVRTPLEFAEVHVPQARLHPLDSLDTEKLLTSGVIRQGQPVYVLCRSGQRARLAVEKLTTAGFDGGVVVEGGTQAWVQAGFPVDRSEVKVISLERQVRIAAGSLVLTGVLLGWFVHRGFFALSGFVGAGLIFAGISDWCGMGLLLAKAPWNQRAGRQG